MPTSFCVNFIDLSTRQSVPGRPTAPRVLQLLNEHRPWDMVENLALIVIHQTYTALLEILGSAAAPSGGGGHVEVSRPVDAADPDSPLLCVNSSATRCCISLIDSSYGGADTPECKKHTSPREKSKPQYRLARATVSVSPGTLHLAHVDDRCRGNRDHWTCADVRPNVSEKGVFGILDTIKMRLDAAIRLEARLIEMAKACGCRSPKVDEVIEVRVALEKMREEVDLDAIMRRRCQKRRRLTQEISFQPDVDHQQVDHAEVLTKTFSALHVCQKRRRGVQEMSCRPAAEMDRVDDVEMLSKRLRAMHV